MFSYIMLVVVVILLMSILDEPRRDGQARERIRRMRRMERQS